MSSLVLFGTLTAIALALLVVLAALAASVVSQARARRLKPAIDEARKATVAALSSGAEADEAVVAVKALGSRVGLSILLDMAESVSGSSQSMLTSIADDAGVLDQARLDLTNRWWWRRLHAARLLTSLGPPSKEYMPLLDDSAPEVRAQAAAWAALQPNDIAIRRLGHMLGDDDGLCRFAAQSALVKVGLQAVDELARLLASGDDALVSRALQVAAAVGDARLVEHLIPLSTSPLGATRALSAAALGRTGDTRCEATLVCLLADEDPIVRSAAAKALATLGCWPAAAAIERLLDDDALEVRRYAGGALTEVGSVGELLLRSSAKGADRAAAAARHALKLESIGNGEVMA